MAKPGEMADLIASAFGAELATVRQQARVLRDGGLMSKEKGGRGPGTLSPRDACHLLIAAAGTRSVAQSTNLVQRPGGLVSTAGQWKTDFITIPELESLPPQHTFADALEALIASAASGALQHAAQELEKGPVDLIHDVAPSLNIEVTIYGPTPRGAIMIEELVTTTLADGSDVRQDRHEDNMDRRFYGDRATEPGAGNLAWLDLSRPKEMDSDLKTSATFSHKTIAAIGQLLAAK